MNSIEINLIVEGQTEQTFVRDILAPEMATKGIYLYPTLIGRVGHKGGNINFDRAQRHIGNFLKQRSNTYVSTMFDYFRIDTNWPGQSKVNQENVNGIILCANTKAEILESNTMISITKLFPSHDVKARFIPYIEMHEFEALLFSDARILAQNIGVTEIIINDILADYDGKPEEINDSPDNAPSKRLGNLFPSYRKVAMGKTIASSIGLKKIREKCPHFNNWLISLENLVG